MSRLCVVIAANEDGAICFWDGRKWRNLDVERTGIIPIWKDSQGKREASISKRFLPRSIDPADIIFAQVRRREVDE